MIVFAVEKDLRFPWEGFPHVDRVKGYKRPRLSVVFG